jgi:hypothetical protein
MWCHRLLRATTLLRLTTYKAREMWLKIGDSSRAVVENNWRTLPERLPARRRSPLPRHAVADALHGLASVRFEARPNPRFNASPLTIVGVRDAFGGEDAIRNFGSCAVLWRKSRVTEQTHGSPPGYSASAATRMRTI